MKRMDLFCSSSSSTATCSSLRYHRHSHSSFRHDPRWKASLLDAVPCSSGDFPFLPKSLSHSENLTTTKKKIYSASKSDCRRKSTSDAGDLDGPFGSSRYLLPGPGAISPESESGSPVATDQNSVKQKKLMWKNDCGTRKWSSSSPGVGRITDESPAVKSSCSGAGAGDQEVALYVSLHCKGCGEKVRKHISKMEGVKSFSIDLSTKKVTIIGDLSPSSVLASVSKVKRAQLWPSPLSLVPPPPFPQQQTHW